MSRPRAVLVSVGDELLSGQTVNTNAAWLARTLEEWGYRVVRVLTVGDSTDEIAEALDAASTAALVVLSGGLGPTPDDRTEEAVAGWLGRPLVVDEEARAAVSSFFAAQGSEVPERSFGQFHVIEGAEVLANPHGTAPGQLVDAEGVRLLLLPGVPREMMGIVEAAAERLRPPGGGAVVTAVVRTTGIEEPHLAGKLEPMLEAASDRTDGVAVAYLPDELGVDVRLSASGPGAGDRVSGVEQVVRGALAEWVYDSPDGDLASAVMKRLRASGRTVAVAESCTAGLVGARLTAPPGASEVFLGGVLAYANEVKAEQLGVDPSVIERHGAVSEETAVQMAAGVRERLGASVGVAVTGVAGPGGGSAEKPVGTVWTSVATEGSVAGELHRFAGDRGAVRRRSAQAALSQLYRILRAESEERS